MVGTYGFQGGFANGLLKLRLSIPPIRKRSDELVVSKVDILIVNLNKVGTSVGTLFELATAHHMHKPIIGYGKAEGLHPWIQECLWRTENNLSDLLAYITGYFDIA